MAYSPATALINANLPATQAVFYDKVGVDALYANLAFQGLVTPKTLPTRAGKQIQIYGYDLSPFTSGVTAGSTPTAASEGTVGTGITPTQSSRTATLGQYVDFVTVSDFAMAVSLDEMEGLVDTLGYRAGLLVDTLIQMGFDSATALDANSTRDLTNNTTYLKANDIRIAAAALAGRNAKTFEGGKFKGIIHPFVAGDVFNDGTANGMTDILKYTESGLKVLQNGANDGTGFRVVDFAGVSFIMSSNVPTTNNIPAAGGLAYSTYIVGKDALFGVSLGNTLLPGEKNFQIKFNKFANGSVADPAGVIGGAVAFNLKYVVCNRPGSTMTFRRIRGCSQIS